jgi:hypothetical protein
MAQKLYVKLQTPTLELTIQAKDGGGTAGTVIAGFKRYPSEQGEVKLKEFQELLGRSDDVGKAAITAFLSSEIVYLKKAPITVEDTETGLIKDIVVKDTRDAVKPNETLWDSPKECLDVLLEMFLDSNPWRVSLIEGVLKSLTNMDFNNDSAKN